MRNLTKKQKVLLMYEYERLIANGIKNPDFEDAEHNNMIKIHSLALQENFPDLVNRLFTDLNLAYNIQKTW